MNDESIDKPIRNIISEVREKVEECYLIAEKHYNEKIPRCNIDFSLTGTKAGTAFFAKKKLRFNRKLLVENREDFLNSTVGHEVAHIVQRFKHGYGANIKSHGKEWKEAMKVLGLPPIRCHSFDTTNTKRKNRKYNYSCGCPGEVFELSLNKHKKFSKSNPIYCPRCQSPLHYEGRISNKKVVAENTGLKEEELD